MADPPLPSPGDWQNAQRVIRALCLQEKYRQCIQVCRDVLRATANDHNPHPLQDAYINFYLGLCHNEVARTMHHNSVAKLPAYEDAEKHYLEALTALPTVKAARALCVRRVKEEVPEDPMVKQSTHVRGPASPTATDYSFFDRPSSPASSLMLSSSPRRHRPAESLPFTSSPFDSPAWAPSDTEDLESHQSFSELMTPHRMQRNYAAFEQTTPKPRYLPREASRMSLIECSPRTNMLPHDASRPSLLDKNSLASMPPRPSSGLMMSSPMGSPARRDSHMPPNMPYSGTFRHSQLPRLSIQCDPRMSAPRLGRSNTRPSTPDLVSPVSPVSPASPLSHGSSVSPVSPIATDGLDYFHSSDASTMSGITTPHRQTKLYETPAPAFIPVSVPSADTFQPKEIFDAGMFARVTDHLAAMRAQLETHMKTVQNAKEHIHRAQALQALSRPHSNKGNRGMFSTPSVASTPSRQQSLQTSRSFWSFAPEDQKTRKKKERIEEGRERKWLKERFDPLKYQRLCENALNEL